MLGYVVEDMKKQMEIWWQVWNFVFGNLEKNFVFGNHLRELHLA